MLRSFSPNSYAQVLYAMECAIDDADPAYARALEELQTPIADVLIDREDAETLAQNLREHLQHDGEEEASFWLPILSRLEASLAR